jgi:hypothetical protein
MGLPDRLADTLSMPEQHEYLRRAFSRRGLLRGGAVAATGVALAGGTAGVAAAATPTLVPGSTASTVHGSLVAPFGRHIAYGADPRTQMRVSWQVPLPVKKPFLRIGISPLDLSHRIPAEVRDLFTPAGIGKSADIDQLLRARGVGQPEPRHHLLLRRRSRRLRPGRRGCRAHRVLVQDRAQDAQHPAVHVHRLR